MKLMHVIGHFPSYFSFKSFKNTRRFGSWLCFRYQVTPYKLVSWIHWKELISFRVMAINRRRRISKNMHQSNSSVSGYDTVAGSCAYNNEASCPIYGEEFLEQLIDRLAASQQELCPV
jgi:hypothetical protein